MNSRQIYGLVKIDKLLYDNFCGVYAADTFNLNRNGFYIVNTAVSTHPGKHWVVYFKKGLYKEFFDSYGNNGNYYNMPDQTFFNTIRLQGDLPVCGYYCICYCMMRCRGISLRKITKMLKKNNSDVMVVKGIIKHFTFLLKLFNRIRIVPNAFI